MSLELIVSILTLIVATISLVYMLRSNRRKLYIDDCSCEIDEHRPPHVFFRINNISSVPIALLKVELVNATVDDYDPGHSFTMSGPFGIGIENILVDSDYADPLKSIKVLQPFSSLELSYYIKEKPDHLKIRITSDKIISFFRRSKLFVIDLD